MPIIKVINEKPIALVELKQRLEEVNKRDSELNHRSKRVKEYLDQFVQIKPSEAEKIKEKLNKLEISKLKEKHITKIIDLNPRDMDNLKSILTGESLTLKPEELTKIFGAIKES